MAGDVTLGVRLKGDSSSAAKAMTITRGELDRLQRELQQTARQTQQADAEFQSLGASLASVDRLALAAGAAVGAIEVGRLAANAISTTADLSRLADSVGVNYERLQELKFAIDSLAIGEVDLGDIVDVLGGLSDAATQAIRGSQDAAQSFRLLGISVDELRGKSPIQLFHLIAGGIKNTNEATTKLAAASQLLGEDISKKLLPVLDQGADGLQDLAEQARETGHVLSDSMGEAAERIDTRFRQMMSGLEARFKKFAVNIVESLSTDLFGALERKSLDQLLAMRAELQANFNQFMVAGEGTAYQEFARAQQYSRALERINRQIAQASRLPTVTTSAPRLEPREPFRPLQGFRAAVHEAHFQKWMRVPTANTKEFNDQIKTAAGNVNQLSRIGTQLGFTFSSAFEEAILQAKSFGDVLRGLAEDIERVLLRKFVTKPIANNIGDIFSSVAASLITGGYNPQFYPLPARAEGGPVMAGQPYMVGERGPELFIPRRNGGIVPNDQLGAITIGGPTINIDARGATKDAVPAIAEVARRIPAMVTATVVEDFSRNGPISKTLRR